MGWLVGGLVLVGLGAGVGWAAATVLTPAEDPLEATEFTYVAVAPGEVGSSINLNTVAEWAPVPVGANKATGTVTEVVVAAGDEVQQGSVLYRVDERPVVVAQGDVPAYRPIESGVRGDDVAQLQRMLDALGFYSGDIDGRAMWSTTAAVRAWQKSLGVEQTGTVGVGDVIFVPTLPTRVSLDTEVISRGASVSGGEAVLRGLPASPSFTVPVTDSQAGMMPPGTRVEIASPEGGEWIGFVVDQRRDEQSGTVIVSLSGVDDSVICGDECGQIPVTGQAPLPSRIVTVETVAGLVVPSAALVTGGDGQIAVIDEDGERIPVTMTASARGMSVVDGVADGTRVRVPASGTTS
ncbi:peptidoglycan-binding protein [Microbacterium invictum]|uniref:Peptidoglycan hydrolase-like protein with peptidoglycan-binding domain n=1 Tax=Microbacterium invictum TaxID=515415 RepID=A0AA40SNR5_9MICO|nr:peptidoglycan-binding domain-containing protein [Microbacterium invictum]MBB4139566.1 peptidoglycan hydrolase-like protein with peptidoglycan-binding domain [Microbacterium invictum]